GFSEEVTARLERELKVIGKLGFPNYFLIVCQAVRFAREHELLVSIRGGGHNVAGLALCDDGLLIDLSPMKGVHVDTQRRIVRAQPGATLGDLDHETQAFGLAVSAGIVTTTGIAGLTLGGGFGWITPKYGLTVDNLLSADVVTAEGELVKASPNDNPDLFWGIRGGGGNFGIVTSFEYQAHPVGPTVYSGVIAHPMEKAREVLSLVRDILVDAPEELTVIPALRIAPPSPLLPQEIHGKPVILVTDKPEVFNHPVIDGLACSWKLATLEEALELIEGLYGRYVGSGAWALARLRCACG
ncbi:hypothetical protein LCGC14_2463150, partial [marine sediment metagenome]